MPLLATPPTVATTLPVVAPAGTGATMLVAAHVVGVAVVPLKVTVLVPLVAPKFVPVIVTGVPTGPVAGTSLVMLGGGEVGEVVTVTLLNTPVVTRAGSRLVTARPTEALAAIGIVPLPNRIHGVPGA